MRLNQDCYKLYSDYKERKWGQVINGVHKWDQILIID